MSELVDRVTGEVAAIHATADGRLLRRDGRVLDYLVPNRRGRTADAASVEVVVTTDRLAEVTLDDFAGEVGDVKLTWAGVSSDVPIVMPGVEASDRVDELLAVGEAELPHLASVLHAPRSRLVEEARLVPVGRARKPARGAVRRLAGHSEDWFHRGLRTVQPKRVLTRRVDLELDVYENRVAVAVLEQYLPQALRRSLSRLAEVEAGLGELTAALQDDGSYFRRERLSGLWGGERGEGAIYEAYERIERIMRDATRFQRRLKPLGGAPLARELRGRRPPAGPLRMTNVLTGDAHYRGVARLWRTVVDRRSSPESDDARSTRLRARHAAMAVYVLALTVRSLRDLGCAPESADEDLRSGVAFAGPWGRGELRLTDHDVVQLTVHGRVRRLVPLAADLEALGLLTGLPSSTTVTYLGSTRDEKRHHVRPGQLPAHVPVNLLEPVSTERLGRIVMWEVVGGALTSYPQRLSVNDQQVPARLSAELAPVEGLRTVDGRTELTRPLTDADLARVEVILDGVRRRARGFGWERDHEVHLDGVGRAVLEANGALRLLLRCPTCPSTATPREFEDREDGYRVGCRSCGSAWGTQRCSACDLRYPFLSLRQPSGGAGDPTSSSQGLERQLGRDHLASPCWVQVRGARTFVCPGCGACPSRDSSEASACTRCAPGDGRAAFQRAEAGDDSGR